MKRIGKLGLCALSVVALALPAVAESSLSGTVVAEDTLAVESPYGGVVTSLPEEGSLVAEDEIVCEVAGEEVYAPVSGTITGVFAGEGSSLDAVVSRYDAVLYIMPDALYKVSASTAGAYANRENYRITIGETVYLRGSSDGTHTGTGWVTGVSGSSYTVEVSDGNLKTGEAVNIFRSEDFSATSRIGKGSVSNMEAVAVTGEGSLARLFVRDGDRVEAGDPLFETVTGTLPYGDATMGAKAAAAGIFTATVSEQEAVTQGQVIGEIAPLDALRVEVNVPESELRHFLVGSSVTIEFLWNEQAIPGTVMFLSAAGETDDSGNTVFRALISFEVDETVRLGMTAVVYAAEDGE